MKHVAGWIYAKDRISVSDTLTVKNYIEQIKASKKSRVIKHYARQIIRTLTTRRRFITRLDFRHLDKILKLINGSTEIEQDVDDIVERVNKTGAWLASYLGGTSWQVLSNLTASEVDYHVKAIARREIKSFIAIIRAQHDPQNFYDDLLQSLNRINSGNNALPESTSDTRSMVDILREGIMVT